MFSSILKSRILVAPLEQSTSKKSKLQDLSVSSIKAVTELVPEPIWSPEFFGPQEIWSPRNLVPEKFGPREIWSPRNLAPEKFGPQECWYLDEYAIK